MASKYPSFSPYVYCANNPIKLVDPNGEEIGEVDEESRKKIDALTTKGSADYNQAFTRKYNQLVKSKTVYNFKEATAGEISEVRCGGVFENENGSVDIVHSEGGIRTTTEGGFSNEYATLFEETFHASEFNKSKLDLNAPTCTDEAKAWKFASKAPGTKYRTSDGDYTSAYYYKTSTITSIAFSFKNGIRN